MGHRLTVVALFVAVALTSTAAADEGHDLDLDAWHRELREAIGSEPEAEPRPPAFGIFPSLGAAFGLPEWIAGQANLYLSYSDGHSFSVYGGVGFEKAGEAEAALVTLGWGGVRRLPGSAPQLGFHGKYLRYRRWEHDDHGVHHGLSVGTETGLGRLAVSFELGAARSDRNHWLITAQVCLKLAVPVHIPLRSTPPDSTADSL